MDEKVFRAVIDTTISDDQDEELNLLESRWNEMTKGELIEFERHYRARLAETYESMLNGIGKK
jgi:hypothetical protein